MAPIFDLRNSLRVKLRAVAVASFDVFLVGIGAYCISKKALEAKPLDPIEDTDGHFTACLNPGWRYGRAAKKALSCLPVRNPESPEIKYEGSWLSVHEFCNRVVQNHPNYPGHLALWDDGYERLWHWHQASLECDKKPSLFLTLPKELRDIIYGYVVGDVVYPKIRQHISGALGACLGNGWVPKAPMNRLKGTHDRADEVPPPKANLMVLSPFIQEEASTVVWNSCGFDKPVVLQQMAWVARSLSKTALSRIELNFDNLDYIRFFGVNLYPWGSPTADAWILSSTTLSNLKDLVIKFRSPCWGVLTSPWRKDGRPTDRHIPKVSIQGYVKTNTKIRFRDALEELKANPSKDEAKVWSMKKCEISEKSAADLPPECLCSTPCSFWGVEAVLQPHQHKKDPKKLFAKYRWDDED